MAFDFSRPAPKPDTLEECHELIELLWSTLQGLVPQMELMQVQIVNLLAQNETLAAENKALRSRVAQLEEQLRTNSSNSSKPPPSDPNRRTKTKSKDKGKKKGKSRCHLAHLPPEVPRGMLGSRLTASPLYWSDPTTSTAGS